ncbi:MAG TPA: glycosyltransferase family 9 protein [Opitutaceae bacterium]|nr:glycosyltransferase family 9 protein [Opitutaceae bacterium]
MAFESQSRVRRLGWYVRELARHGIPARVVVAYDGVGDELMTAGALREMHARGWRRTWFLTRYPGLFRQGDVGCRFLPWHPYYVAIARRLKRPVFRPGYSDYLAAEDRDRPLPGHVIANLCRSLGATGIIQLRPFLQLDDAEYAGGRRLPGQIAVQSSCAGARLPMATKQWPAERMQQVVDWLVKEGHSLVQLGMTSEPALKGVLDLRGKLTLRATAAVLAASRLFIGLVGGLMHLARAVDCRAVIVYGGRELPAQSGYRGNINLIATPPCAPCYLRNRCPHELVCLDAIRPDSVLDAARTQLGQGSPMEPETVNI